MRGLPSNRQLERGGKTFPALYRYVLDLFFPPRCVHCHTVGRPICAKCLARIEWIAGPRCRMCGQPLGKTSRHACVDPLMLRWIRSAAVYSGPMRRAIHALKYSSDRVLASFLMELAYPHFDPPPVDFDRILPVPLGRLREKKRGYNQAVLLADAFSRMTNIPVDGNSLVRSRETRSQVGLSHTERRKNVDQAFSASSVPGENVLVIDDVCTTGATLQSCAEALRRAGARSVAGLTLARAVLPGLDPHSQFAGG